MKKRCRPELKVFFMILFISLCSSVFAKDGVMWGEGKLSVIQTQWFDIIFPETSRDSAFLLARHCDRIYYETAGELGFEPRERFPVVLSSKTERFNAYYSSQYYNHIVLYDTSTVEDMALFTDDFLSTFRHELTHAVSFNIKNGFWRGVGKVLGDCVNPGGLFITMGWSEGASVAEESRKGEGRLNDEYSRHMVKQAKIEKNFPRYADVQGASDIYPYGSYYNFNAEFARWLQNEFGMEKYAGFWYRCVNFKTWSCGHAFRKVYGLSLNKAWEEFYESLEVPHIPAVPLESGAVTDFFTGSGEKYSAENSSGLLFSDLFRTERGLYWLEENSGTVRLCPPGETKAEKIIQVKGTEHISVSDDGRIISINYTDEASGVFRKCVKVFDAEKKNYIQIKSSGLSDSCVVQKDGEYFLVSRAFLSQKKWTDVKKLIFKNGKLSGSEDYGIISYGPSVMTLSLSTYRNGEFVFVKRDGLLKTLCVADLSGNVISETSFPDEKMSVRNLYADSSSGIVWFSWAKPGTLPRAGFWNPEDGSFCLMDHDVSGGVFNPVPDGRGAVVYSGHFFRQNRLFSVKSESLGLKAVSGSVPLTAGSALSEVREENPESLPEAEPFRGGKYFTRGLLVPLSFCESMDFDPRSKLYGTKTMLPLGVTWLTNNPWTSDFFDLSAGFSPFTESFAFRASAQGGSDTSLLSWNTAASTEFDMQGFKQGRLSANGAVKIPAGKISYFSFSEEALLAGGRGNDPERQYEILYAGNVLNAAWSNAVRKGPGFFEYGGITAGVSLIAGAAAYAEDFEMVGDNLSLSPFLKVYVPKLIPVKCTRGMVYNLPLVVSAAFLESSRKKISAKADAVLFSMDVQKAVPFATALFVNRFYVSGGYGGNLLNLEQGNVYTDYIYMNLSAGITPNIGLAANSMFYTEIISEFRYTIRPVPGQNALWTFSLGFSGRFF